MLWKRLSAAVAWICLAACSDKTSVTAADTAVEVRAITVQPQAVPVTTELPGRTAAFASAEIRPQVGGIVLARTFTEGGDVEAGQVLFRIDPAEARATVANAQATLASALAGLASARENATRYRELVAIEAVSRESADAAQVAFEQAQAQVNATRAVLDSAKLSLGYADVTSPINGRIGRSSVSVGALVTAGQTIALATVQQLDPIYVDVTQPAAEMLRFRRAFDQGRLKIDGNGRPTARLMLEDGSAYERQGQLLLAESIVSETAGSVTLRAQFPNPQGLLLPGMYVRMTLEGAVAGETLLVPQVAVTRDARGNALVFVVGADGKVTQRSLQATQAVGDQWIVESGLKADERVVVEGMQRLREGMTVKVVPEAAAASAAASTDPAAD